MAAKRVITLYFYTSARRELSKQFLTNTTVVPDANTYVLRCNVTSDPAEWCLA